MACSIYQNINNMYEDVIMSAQGLVIGTNVLSNITPQNVSS